MLRKKNIFLSIIVPAYNEVESIRSNALGKISGYLIKQKYTWEVLIVDDGSTDETYQLASQFAQNHKGFKVLAETHKGKGGAVIAGMLNAQGKIILFMDMDQATPIDQIKRLLPKFDQGFDIAIGSRSGRHGAPLIRKAMAFVFAILRALILRLPYKDTQCGFKAFTRKSALEIFKRMKIFNDESLEKGAAVKAGFDLEILYIARKLNLKVSEVPVIWGYGKRMKVNPIKDSWQGLRDLMRVRIYALMGRYHVAKSKR